MTARSKAMLSARLFVYTVVTCVLVLVLFAVGWIAAGPILDLAITGLDLPNDTRLHLSSPAGPAGYYTRVAAAFAVAPALAWLGVLLHRSRAGSEPSPRAFVLFIAVPLAGGFAGILLRVLILRLVFLRTANLGIDSTLSIGGLALGSWGLACAILSGIAMGALVVWKAPRSSASS